MDGTAIIEALRGLPCGPALLRAAGPGTWLVGGAVRDLALGRSPRELDVLVEGDVAPLAGALRGDVVRHERFGTATVTAGPCRYDLARARTERYPRPGALPEVAWADAAADLARRDIRVNAVAVRLADGEVLAAPGALEDLRDGVVAVLHDGSFADDPTRVWRVARYAARLGFDVAPHTRALAGAAGPGEVSGERIGHELRLMLGEDDPTAGLALLAQIAPQALPEGFDPAPPVLPQALALLPDDGRPAVVVLAACTAAMDADLLVRWLVHLGWPADERDAVAAASRWVTGAPLRAAATPAQIARAATGVPVEAVALAGGPNARRWLQELRHVRLQITGADLIAAGVPEGPQVGEALRRALEAKLDGRADDRAAELAAALA